MFGQAHLLRAGAGVGLAGVLDQPAPAEPRELVLDRAQRDVARLGDVGGIRRALLEREPGRVVPGIFFGALPVTNKWSDKWSSRPHRQVGKEKTRDLRGF